jgi:hypothetical protein
VRLREPADADEAARRLERQQVVLVQHRGSDLAAHQVEGQRAQQQHQHRERDDERLHARGSIRAHPGCIGRRAAAA